MIMIGKHITKKEKKKNEKKLLIGLVMGFLMLGIVGGASAATVFLDDFEDGDTLGWNATASGSGSTGVELHNSSQMAFAHQIGNGLHSLSFDFDYTPTDTLSFDMHAVAYNNGHYHSNSGVKFSFTNNFNIELESAGLVNATDNSWIGENDSLIDNNQHNYKRKKYEKKIFSNNSNHFYIGYYLRL